MSQLWTQNQAVTPTEEAAQWPTPTSPTGHVDLVQQQTTNNGADEISSIGTTKQSEHPANDGDGDLPTTSTGEAMTFGRPSNTLPAKNGEDSASKDVQDKPTQAWTAPSTVEQELCPLPAQATSIGTVAQLRRRSGSLPSIFAQKRDTATFKLLEYAKIGSRKTLDSALRDNRFVDEQPKEDLPTVPNTLESAEPASIDAHSAASRASIMAAKQARVVINGPSDTVSTPTIDYIPTDHSQASQLIRPIDAGLAPARTAATPFADITSPVSARNPFTKPTSSTANNNMAPKPVPGPSPLLSRSISPLPSFSHKDLEARFVACMADFDKREASLMDEFKGWKDIFLSWAEDGRKQEEERGVKRLHTRATFVQQLEREVEGRRAHLMKVVQAFESALAILAE